MEITVKNYTRSRKWGWGYSFTPTGKGCEIETPTKPDHTGTLKQIAEAIESDSCWQVHSRSAFFATAWFYNGRRITRTWAWTNLTPLVADGEWVPHLLVQWGYGWIPGFVPDESVRMVRIWVADEEGER